MQSKQVREEDDAAKGHSDSDDWTLVSPPTSANTSNANSPERESSSAHSLQFLVIDRNKEPTPKRQKHPKQSKERTQDDPGEDQRRQAEASELELRASGSQDADDEEDDGLVEIDLNLDDEIKNSKLVPERSGPQTSILRSRKSTKSVEFAPIGGAQTTAKTRDCSTNTQTAIIDSKEPNDYKMDSSVRSLAEHTTNVRSIQRNRLPSSFRECLYSVFILALIAIIYAQLTEKMIEEKSHRRFFDLLGSIKSAKNDSDIVDLFYVPPEDTAYMQLKKLDSELEACIRERGYGWLKNDGKLSHQKTGDLNEKVTSKNPKFKPFRGLVCYENESVWRERFKKLKDEYNLDLRKLSKQGYKRVANNFLREIHSGFRFSLVLNQLEYLDYLDELRRRQEMERLKADNLDLKKRLAKLSSLDSGERKLGQDFIAAQSTRSLVRLESENEDLKRENNALKASLVEKAGTVYIKQSIELEKCKRENVALRQFHQQVAGEVFKSFKQLDLHTIDAAGLLNDHSSLSSQLALTRGYLLRLGDEITKLVAKTKTMEKESEFYKVLLDTLESKPRAKQIEHNDAEQLVGGGGFIDRPEDQTVLDSWSMKYNQDLNLSSDDRLKGLELLSESKMSREQNKSAIDSVRVEHTVETVTDHPGDQIGPDDRGDLGTMESTETRGNWLMRRAKLRERLRKSSGIDIIEKQIDRLIDESNYLYNKRGKQSYSHDSKETKLYHKKRHQHAHKQHATRHEEHPPRKDHRDKNQKQNSRSQSQEKPSTLLEQLEAKIANFRIEL